MILTSADVTTSALENAAKAANGSKKAALPEQDQRTPGL